MPYNIIPDDVIEQARAVRVESVVERYGIVLRGRGAEREGPCPQCGGRDRFSINTQKNVFNCRICGGRGDVIALVQHTTGCTFVKAVEALTGTDHQHAARRVSGAEIAVVRHLGAVAADADYEQRQHEKARFLWRASLPATGTIVETYLQNARNIACALPTTVRFLPSSKPHHHPAMIVPFGLPEEPESGVLSISEAAITAVQLTLLKPDGGGKAETEANKLTIGSPGGMPTVLAPPNDLLALCIAEGTEEALTDHDDATGRGAWASGGAAFLPKLANVMPSYIEAVTIIADGDEAGQRYSRELADALVQRGIEVFTEGLRP